MPLYRKKISHLAVTHNVIKNKQTINLSDSVWRWDNRKYAMSQIVQEFHSVEKKNALTLLFSTIFANVNKTITNMIWNAQIVTTWIDNLSV